MLTGITGFADLHTAIQLLENGYHLAGTWRHVNRATSMKRSIAPHYYSRKPSTYPHKQ